MKYIIETNTERVWQDEIHCICWMANMSSRLYTLSKKKLLEYFAQSETINSFHILLLDKLSKLYSFAYYVDENELIISIHQDKHITLHVPQEAFEDIIINSSVKQHK